MKKFSLFIAVLATASFAFAGDVKAGADKAKADVNCDMPCCKEAKVSCQDCKTCSPDKAKCDAKCEKPCCKDAKACAADKAKCDVKCDKPCCKDAKACAADKAKCEKPEAKEAPKQ